MWIEIIVLIVWSLTLPSPSARKVWIEILFGNHHFQYDAWSPSARKVWIEIPSYSWTLEDSTSPSARKVWIEMAGR